MTGFYREGLDAGALLRDVALQEYSALRYPCRSATRGVAREVFGTASRHMPIFDYSGVRALASPFHERNLILRPALSLSMRNAWRGSQGILPP